MEAPSITVQRARDLRKQMSPPEALLWEHLRNRRLAGLKFRRQHPVGPFILDFYCDTARLAVEVDGAVHGQPDQQARDARRTAWLQREGVEVLRLWARDIYDDLPATLSFIADKARVRT